MVTLEAAYCTYHIHTGPVQAVAWSPTGRYIASAGEESVEGKKTEDYRRAA